VIILFHNRLLSYVALSWKNVGWLDVEFRNGKDHELYLHIGLVGVIRSEPLFLAYVRHCRGLSQQLDTGKAKAELTKKFFRQPGLPSPFDSKKFQRRALSNTYLTGGVYTWIGRKNLVCTIEFVVRSIVSDPINGFHILVVWQLSTIPCGFYEYAGCDYIRIESTQGE
jgi:hypothetical protein